MENYKMFFLLFLIVIGNVFSEEKITITVGEWPPYLGSKLPDNGIAGQIIKEAFASAGVIVEFKYFPWKRAMELAKGGEYEGTAVWLKNSEREKDFYYSAPVISEKHVLFHLKKQPLEWQDINDLAGKKMGGLIGFSYGVEFDKMVKDGKIIMENVSDDETNFKKLLTNRIIAYPQEVNVGYYVLDTKFLAGEKAQIAYNDKPILEQNSYLLLNKTDQGNVLLLKKFNEGLSKLIKEGKIEKIYDEMRLTK